MTCNVAVDECLHFSTIMLLTVLHYASICSYASTLLLCSKLCQHNSPRPNTDGASIFTFPSNNAVLLHMHVLAYAHVSLSMYTTTSTSTSTT